MVNMKFVPSGFTGDWIQKPLEGIIEKHLADNWNRRRCTKEIRDQIWISLKSERW